MNKRLTFAAILLWTALSTSAQSAFPPMNYSKATHKESARKSQTPESVIGSIRVEHLPNLKMVTVDYNGYFFRYSVVSISHKKDGWVVTTDSSIKLEISTSEVLVYRTKSAYSRFYN
ncbi:hypothetical protein UFOVP1492_49 [uncultured Caudovirales phage]|uniref:Uncharacterized protein n=1 Tax=uncultured Caudovirales phage TaxID=2100421 RepID=A0A6J5SS55_9CAUD|nr:hypothetical protein UFOVP1127_85 [uncultured Caudovirales phage]CAB4193668.1 hypothetical protein UFOVP1242_125 [uncultured Caudovirales phage]CAB4217604.1 hypothetical protein UFOVP1492_49 [uncultured Caudovirales phage]CAB5231422.1 hypothetical protein UFOVP1580_78 [uncultured Caudovirales phage]